MNEKISQLVDHELTTHQREALLEQVSTDEVARKSWQCYHLIGNVIRNEVSSTGNDLAALIRNNLEKEPTVLAPLSITISASTAKTDRWKPVSIFAIAASLVLVAVVTLSPLQRPNKDSADLGNNRVTHVQDADYIFREFDEMLINHAEFAASPGMSDLIFYARVVSAGQISNKPEQ